MIRRYLLFTIISCFIIGTMSCNNNKIPCPTYADSMPESKKKVKPGSQKPDIPKATKAKSGVLPSDGRGTRTKVPK